MVKRRAFLKTSLAAAGTAAMLSTDAGSGIATAESTGAAGAMEACKVGANPNQVPPAVEELRSDDPDEIYNGDIVSPGNFDTPGHPHREAYRSLAETERRFRDGVQQQKAVPSPADFENVVNAVDDLGADPSGETPANSAIESGAEPGTLIILPKGATFLLDGDLNLSPSGAFGMVGKGFENTKKPPGESAPRFVSAPNTQARLILGPVERGLFGGFILDQSANVSGIGLLAETESGFVLVRAVRVIGVQDNTSATGQGNQESTNHSLCTPIARSSEGAIRVQQFIMSDHGIPGDKNSGGVPGFWVGKTNRGLVELVQCASTGGSDNGIYGSRTHGDLHIIDGAYFNNEVSQIRFAGEGSWAVGCTVGLDREKYDGPRPSEFLKEFSSNGVKTEIPDFIDKPGGGRLENCEVVARNVTSSNVGSLIFVRGFSGALTVNNCRVINGVDGMASLSARPPGSGYGTKSKPPYAVNVSDSTFTGIQNSAAAIEIQDRPASTVTNTCIKIEGAGPGDIVGASANKCTYGMECKSAGTTGPVGSAVNFVVGGITSFVSGLFKGAAVIATVPFIILLVAGLLSLLLASSLPAAFGLLAAAIKFFAKD
ncbi:hypothetical protein C449_13242 [Halococcus saccharolyticus DSM 5350]|uniref:Right handed beta helix domain-containing protein n=1 Tax=Halococcus saccharolyticus DSM 5350 TaxID=1227455 RepID=M0MDZ6_9EURY|nr:hypothetical protein C449_13242 [Halococcus saccharolyticus DSM 5350]